MTVSCRHIVSDMGSTCSMYGERRGACRDLVGKPEGKRRLGRHRCRWENNVKLHFEGVGWSCEVD
jgi:hypothetical protein